MKTSVKYVAPIWLPKVRIYKDSIIQSFSFYNPTKSMDDSVVLKENELQMDSLPFLSLINEECLEFLEKADHKLQYGCDRSMEEGGNEEGGGSKDRLFSGLLPPH